MSTFSIARIKSNIGVEDSIHDARINSLLTQTEEQLSAPNGMTRYIIGTSGITFCPEGNFTRLPATIIVRYLPITTIDSVFVVREGTDTNITHTVEYQASQTTITLTQAIREGEVLTVTATGGFTEDTAPPKLKFIADQITALKFWNPDPTNQNIPQEIHNQINAL